MGELLEASSPGKILNQINKPAWFVDLRGEKNGNLVQGE